MSERVYKRRTRSSLSQEGVFVTSRALEEFLAFTDYDLFPWLNEVKQILQIHIAYKIAMDSCCLGNGIIPQTDVQTYFSKKLILSLFKSAPSPHSLTSR